MADKGRQAEKKISEYVEAQKAQKGPKLPADFYAKLGQKLDKADEAGAKRGFMPNPWLRGAALGFAVLLTVVMVREYQRQGLIGETKQAEAEYAGLAAAKPAAGGVVQPSAKSLSKNNVPGSVKYGYTDEKKQVPMMLNEDKLKLDVMKDVDLASAAKTESQVSADKKQAVTVNSFRMAAAPAAAPAAEAGVAAEAVMEEAEAVAEEPVAASAPVVAKKAKAAVWQEKAPARIGVSMWSGTVSGVTESQNKVFKDSASLQTFLKSHPDIRSGMDVDFTTSMIVGVFIGQRNTAGYSAIISSVEEKEDSLVVTYLEIKPQPGAMLAQMITSPYAMKAVARTEKKVVFVKK